VLLVRLRKIYLGDKLLPTPHPFEEEVESLLRANHFLLFGSIADNERKGEAAIRENPEAEEPEFVHADISDMHDFFNELRSAATNLTLVGLVTRLQHWISIFVEELTKENAKDRGLTSNLKTLNKETGSGLVPIEFFQGLSKVRNSIVHADSEVEWNYLDKKQRVPERYINSTGQLDFKEADLDEAMKNSITQVKWYDDRLEALGVFGQC
jgi:hypothetical protein